MFHESESLPLIDTMYRERSYIEPQSISFQDILSGEKAFYDQPDYLEATERDFSQRTALPVSYTWNTEHKAITIAKQIL